MKVYITVSLRIKMATLLNFIRFLKLARSGKIGTSKVETSDFVHCIIRRITSSARDVKDAHTRLDFKSSLKSCIHLCRKNTNSAK